jgi:hypothetical protein
VSYSSEVLADAPWGFWEQAETSGTNLNDSTANNRDMTITGSGHALAQTGPATALKAIHWPADAGSYAKTADSHQTSPATLEGWLYLTATPSGRTPVLCCQATDGSGSTDKNVTVESDGKLRFQTTSGTLVTPSALSLNAWHHIVCSVGAAGMKIRVDKVTLESNPSFTTSYTGKPQWFQVHKGDATQGGSGANGAIRVAAPAFYTSQLSDARTDAHYDGAESGTPSLYMPDVQVEIAFNAGVRTAAASRVWTDVSDYAELDRGVDIDAWRADEFSTCDANTLRLTLDNRDGRFTPGRAASPYYPNIKIGRPIRVTATPVGGSASVRFVGFIDEWPLEWDGSDQNAYAQVAATSRLARLGNDRKLRSIVEEEILLDTPLAYYPLSEAAGATSAADASGSPSPASLVQKGSGAAVTFGTATGPSTDGLTAASLTGGKHLGLTSPTALATEASGITIECFLNTSGSNDQVMEAWAPLDAESVQSAADIAIDGSGRVTSSGGTIVGPTVADGLTHHAAATVSAAGSYVLYADGVSAGSGTLSIGSPVSLSVGANAFGGNAFVGTLAHAAIFNRAVSASRIAAHADAGRTGFAGETPGARFARYASYAGIPAAEVDADAGTSPMAHIDTTDKTVLELLRTVETTEGGVLFDGRDGTLEFRSRSSRYTATSAFTLSVTSQQVETGLSPKLDRSAIQNDVTATLADSTVTARATNATSVNDYGTKGDDIELATTDANEPHSAAWWRVNTYAEPTSRVPALAVEILALDAATQALVLAAEPGTRFTVTGLPSQAASSTGDYFVEGASESVSPESYVVTFNVSDATPYVSTLVLDSATRGLLDTNRLAY